MDPESPEPPKGVAEDADLVRRTRAGDRSAFGLLAQKYAGVVRALAGARVGAGADLEDVVQDVFLLALRRLPDLDRPERFAGWISRIAVNRAVEVLRRRSVRRVASLDGGVSEPTAPAATDPLEAEDEVRRMLGHLSELDEKTQTVLALRFRAGMAVKDIAVKVGDRPPAVAMRISRALRRLRERMDGGPR